MELNMKKSEFYVIETNFGTEPRFLLLLTLFINTLSTLINIYAQNELNTSKIIVL